MEDLHESSLTAQKLKPGRWFSHCEGELSRARGSKEAARRFCCLLVWSCPGTDSITASSSAWCCLLTVGDAAGHQNRCQSCKPLIWPLEAAKIAPGAPIGCTFGSEAFGRQRSTTCPHGSGSPNGWTTVCEHCWSLFHHLIWCCPRTDAVNNCQFKRLMSPRDRWSRCWTIRIVVRAVRLWFGLRMLRNSPLECLSAGPWCVKPLVADDQLPVLTVVWSPNGWTAVC